MGEKEGGGWERSRSRKMRKSCGYYKYKDSVKEQLERNKVRNEEEEGGTGQVKEKGN